MRQSTMSAIVATLATAVLLSGCSHSGSTFPGLAPGAGGGAGQQNPPAQQGGGQPGGGQQGGGQQGQAGGTPCWAGTWVVRSKTVTTTAADGSTISVTGDAGEVMTFQTNGVLFVDYSNAGALVGTTGSGAIAVQYQGTEDAQLSMTGSASGTFTERIVDGALFTTVSDGQSNTQQDQVGATETDQYTCTGSQLTLQGQGVREVLARNG